MDEYGYMLSKYYDFMTFSKVFICYGFPSILLGFMECPSQKEKHSTRLGQDQGRPTQLRQQLAAEQIYKYQFYYFYLFLVHRKVAKLNNHKINKTTEVT